MTSHNAFRPRMTAPSRSGTSPRAWAASSRLREMLVMVNEMRSMKIQSSVLPHGRLHPTMDWRLSSSSGSGFCARRLFFSSSQANRTSNGSNRRHTRGWPVRTLSSHRLARLVRATYPADSKTPAAARPRRRTSLRRPGDRCRHRPPAGATNRCRSQAEARTEPAALGWSARPRRRTAGSRSAPASRQGRWGWRRLGPGPLSRAGLPSRRGEVGRREASIVQAGLRQLTAGLRPTPSD